MEDQLGNVGFKAPNLRAFLHTYSTGVAFTVMGGGAGLFLLICLIALAPPETSIGLGLLLIMAGALFITVLVSSKVYNKYRVYLNLSKDPNMVHLILNKDGAECFMGLLVNNNTVASNKAHHKYFVFWSDVTKIETVLHKNNLAYLRLHLNTPDEKLDIPLNYFGNVPEVAKAFDLFYKGPKEILPMLLVN